MREEEVVAHALFEGEVGRLAVGTQEEKAGLGFERVTDQHKGEDNEDADEEHDDDDTNLLAAREASDLQGKVAAKRSERVIDLQDRHGEEHEDEADLGCDRERIDLIRCKRLGHNDEEGIDDRDDQADEQTDKLLIRGDELNVADESESVEQRERLPPVEGWLILLVQEHGGFGGRRRAAAKVVPTEGHCGEDEEDGHADWPDDAKHVGCSAQAHVLGVV